MVGERTLFNRVAALSISCPTLALSVSVTTTLLPPPAATDSSSLSSVTIISACLVSKNVSSSLCFLSINISPLNIFNSFLIDVVFLSYFLSTPSNRCTNVWTSSATTTMLPSIPLLLSSFSSFVRSLPPAPPSPTTPLSPSFFSSSTPMRLATEAILSRKVITFCWYVVILSSCAACTACCARALRATSVSLPDSTSSISVASALLLVDDAIVDVVAAPLSDEEEDAAVAVVAVVVVVAAAAALLFASSFHFSASAFARSSWALRSTSSSRNSCISCCLLIPSVLGSSADPEPVDPPVVNERPSSVSLLLLVVSRCISNSMQRSLFLFISAVNSSMSYSRDATLSSARLFTANRCDSAMSARVCASISLARNVWTFFSICNLSSSNTFVFSSNSISNSSKCFAAMPSILFSVPFSRLAIFS